MTAVLLLGLGLLLVVMALGESAVRRQPMSASVVYLLGGYAVARATRADEEARVLEVLLPHAHAWTAVTEGAVLLSLFAVGIKMRRLPSLRRWRVAVLLATVVMVLCMALTTVAAQGLLALSWPAALLLAGIVAPTDPVLASDVQVRSSEDRDTVRVALTAEGALNDATAFPVVLLALAWLGVHAQGEVGWRWGWHDLLWPLAGGLLVGMATGRALGWLVGRRLHAGARLGWDELLYIGTVVLVVGLSRALEVSSFLAVFAAALALGYVPRGQRDAAGEQGETHAHLTRRLVAFGERCERLIEVAMVLSVGAALAWLPAQALLWPMVALALLLIGVIRPLSVWIVLRLGLLSRTQRRLVAWFGIRGVGSLFYLAFALAYPLDTPAAESLFSACTVCIACSVLLHGISATPLMAAYHRRRKAAGAEP